MRSKYSILVGGLLLTLPALSQAVTVFGYSHTAVGQAAVSVDTSGKLWVHNLGSSGQDGTSIDITAVSGSSPHFGFDVDVTPDNLPIGGFFKATSTGVGTVGVTSTMTATTTAAGTTMGMDFSPYWNGQPLTVNYYAGGPGGALVYTEQVSSPTFNMYAGGPINTAYVDLEGDFPFYKLTGGFDFKSSGGTTTSFVTAGGTTLPATDNIGLVDVVAPTNIQPQYSSFAITAGGGITGFDINGEVAAVPEPSTFALLALGAVSLTRRGRSRRSK